MKSGHFITFLSKTRMISLGNHYRPPSHTHPRLTRTPRTPLLLATPAGPPAFLGEELLAAGSGVVCGYSRSRGQTPPALSKKHTGPESRESTCHRAQWEALELNVHEGVRCPRPSRASLAASALEVVSGRRRRPGGTGIYSLCVLSLSRTTRHICDAALRV